ncbi:MAG TPA: acyl carrier protein [Polyangiaceae bacterium]
MNGACEARDGRDHELDEGCAARDRGDHELDEGCEGHDRRDHDLIAPDLDLDRGDHDGITTEPHGIMTFPRLRCYAPGMASYEESLKVTCQLLRRHVKEPRAIHPTDKIQNDLGVDSLGVMELVADVETRFGVSIPSEMFDKIVTVEDVARAVTELQRQ